MKTRIAFIAFAALFAGAAASQDRADLPAAKHVEQPPGVSAAPLAPAPHRASTTQPVSDAGSIVNDVRIELALFGSGARLADVTDRVVQLLRSEPNGFTARADWLHIDPVPGKNKSLMIRYRYHDQERLFLITGGNRVNYSALVEGDCDK